MGAHPWSLYLALSPFLHLYASLSLHLSLSWFCTQSLSEGEGNIHSGATPPWLRDNNDDGCHKGSAPILIGPSEEEFLHHSK